ALSALTSMTRYSEKRSLLLERLRQAVNLVRARRHSDRRALEVVRDRLVGPAEALGEEDLVHRVEALVVLGPHEAVALVRVEHVGHRDLLVVHGLDDLVGLGLLHPGIVFALPDEERPLDLIGPEERRPVV